MTNYETATLALQHAGLWIAGAQVGVSILQSALIAGGLWLMWKASTARDNQHQEAKDRHEETMAVLRQQGEDAARQHAESMVAFRQQGEALRTLIERTAQPTPTA